ncbi:MAG: hypothetical protein GTN69_09285 [Armatimonadetes bacterium]|nr:hypothetical protein [Armatimonadota bacterium]NIO76054.1 hypothetical protein [Armatimonadota bacterium]NIO97001.1 hypothetical protein [Armatimonadota bacterium]
MRTYGWSLLVVVIVIAGLLVAPATREVVRIEASAFCPFARFHNLYPHWSARDRCQPPGPDLNIDQLSAQARAKRPEDWKTALAIGLLAWRAKRDAAMRYYDTPRGGALYAQAEEQRLACLEEVVELAPDEPIALITLLGAHMPWLSWSRQDVRSHRHGGESPSDFTEELLTAENTKFARETLERLKRIDPDNAFPEALLAWLDFGEKRDTEALAHLKAAVAKPKWDLYEGALARTQIQVWTDAGIPEFEASWLSATWEPWAAFSARLRNDLAYAAAFKAEEAKKAGRDQEAVEDWMAVIKLGRLIRHKGHTFIEILVGIGIEEIGARPMYSWVLMEPAAEHGLKPASELAGKEGRYRGGDIFEREPLDYFLKHAGAGAAADVLAGLEQGQELRLEMREYLDKAYEKEHHIDRRAIGTLIGGTIILGQMMLLLALTILLWMVVRDRARSATRLRRFWVIILALIPLALTLPYSSLYLICVRGPSDEHWLTFLSKNLMQFHPAMVLATLPVILILCTLFAGVWIKRKSRGRHSWRAIFAGVLRQVAPVCLVLLTLCYALNTIQAARLRAKAVSITNRYIAGEMTEFRSQHPQFFTTPVPVEPE